MFDSDEFSTKTQLEYNATHKFHRKLSGGFNAA